MKPNLNKQQTLRLAKAACSFLTFHFGASLFFSYNFPAFSANLPAPHPALLRVAVISTPLQLANKEQKLPKKLGRWTYIQLNWIF